MAAKQRASSGVVEQEAVRQFVENLNGSAPFERVRHWVAEWLRVGRDLWQLPRELQEEINEGFGKCKPQMSTLYAPPQRGSFYTTWPFKPGVMYISRVERHLRAAEFMEFLKSPESSRLTSCARSGCGRFFLREGRRTTYCSSKCAHGDSARRATKQRREQETRRRLKEARTMMEKFGDPWQLDWKERVCDTVHVSKNWVTRHQNKDDLPRVPPKKSTARRRR